MADQGVEIFAGVTYEDQFVPTDGRHFHDCTFILCKLVYTGTSQFPVFSACSFQDTRWHLAEQAANTIMMLASLYGTPFRSSVEAVLRQITGGQSVPGPGQLGVTLH